MHITLTFILTILSSSFNLTFQRSDDLHRTILTGHRLPMIIPLYSPQPNSSQTIDHGRRKLQNSDAIAHMRLYDDLLFNGYYTTRLWIGSPPQKFALIVDTGSTVTYVPCSTCKKCGLHQDPRFKPELSSTYRPIKCSMDCTCDQKGEQCTYDRRYAEMSSSSGVLGEDTISFGSESELHPQRAVFGCENAETGDLYSQRADGIMGLGRGRISIVDQLVEKHAIRDSFSLCYGGMNVGGGALVLGSINPPRDMSFSYSDAQRSPYYNIELNEMHVAGKPLEINSKIFDGKHGTVLDSGTTYAYLPEVAFVAFKDAIMKKVQTLKQIHGPDPNYNDICFSGAGRDVSKLSNSFPEVTMVFKNGHKWSLTPENYLFQHTKVHGAYCLGIFQNGNDPTTLLGGIIVRNTLVTYDRENERIGFWKTNCSELWKEQNTLISSPFVPSKSSRDTPPISAPANRTSGFPPISVPSNKTSETLPTVPLGNLHHNVFPDEFQVKSIKFDMSLSVNNSSMSPNFTELTNFIAHELEVDSSRVHLLNSTSYGNTYIVKWALYPAESADYVSNMTPKSIIQHLNELQLPRSFGSYKLVEWNVEPQAKRTWLGQHFVGVVGIVITLIVCLSSLTIVLIWRRKQVLNMYKPVDAAIPEQELQPI